MVAAGNDGQFKTLCGPEILNTDWASDDRFATNANRVVNRADIVQMCSDVLKTRSTDEWVEKLTGKGWEESVLADASLPFAPINNIAKTFNHPQAKARGVVEEIEHPRAGKIKIAAAPVMYDGKKSAMYRPPPYLGQHTDEVLSEMGYSAKEIEEIHSAGAV